MIAAIYVLLFFALALYGIAFYSREIIAVIFSGTLFVLGGLSIITSGLQDLPVETATWVGIIVLFFGLYLLARTGLEWIGSTMN
jgi:hypothetical protein